MRVISLSCHNFRNIEEIELSSFEDMNVICGENAQGKTNLIEAIWLFTGLKSFRSAKDAEFIRFGSEKAELKLQFKANGIDNEAEFTIREKRVLTLNQNKLKSPAQMAGKFNAIVFSPNDLGLIKDGPAGRRRFLDIAIGQLYPAYIGILRSYIRAVTQRNSVIKDYKYDSSLSIMLDIFEQEIAEKGSKIMLYRKRFLESLNQFLPEVYAGLSHGAERLDTSYQFVCDSDDLAERLQSARKNDMYTGTTSVGPHRDDIVFQINGVSARSFGSQGQKRSAALAVKLSEAEVIRKVTGEYPVFLLDDVMSELDPARQSYILNHIKGIQSFITCCDPSNVANLKKGKIINMKSGKSI